jgi:hypothetical protein
LLALTTPIFFLFATDMTKQELFFEHTAWHKHNKFILVHQLTQIETISGLRVHRENCGNLAQRTFPSA